MKSKEHMKKWMVAGLTIAMTIGLLCGCAEETEKITVSGISDPAQEEEVGSDIGSEDVGESTFSGDWNITCVDQNGDPIEGVRIQMCTETICTNITSDESGRASFDGQDPYYELCVLRTPKGYELDGEEEIIVENDGAPVVLSFVKTDALDGPTDGIAEVTQNDTNQTGSTGTSTGAAAASGNPEVKASPSPAPKASPSPSPKVSPSPSPKASPSPAPKASPSPAPKASPSPTPAPTPEPTPEPTPAPSATFRDYVQPTIVSGSHLSFSTTDQYGNYFDSSYLSGYRVVLINMFEPWCGPCVREMPALEQIYQNYKDQGVLVIGVHSDSSGLSDVLAQTGVTYPILQMTSDFYPFQTGYVPTTFFVDGQGNELRTTEDELTWASVAEFEGRGYTGDQIQSIVDQYRGYAKQQIASYGTVFVGGKSYSEWEILVKDRLY